MLLASSHAASQFPPGGLMYDVVNSNPVIPQVIQSIGQRVRQLPQQIVPILTAIAVCQADLMLTCQQPILLSERLWCVLGKLGGIQALAAAPSLLADVRTLRQWHADRLRHLSNPYQHLLMPAPTPLLPPAFLSPPASSSAASTVKSDFIERHQSIASLLERPRRVSCTEPLNLSLPRRVKEEEEQKPDARLESAEEDVWWSVKTSHDPASSSNCWLGLAGLKHTEKPAFFGTHGCSSHLVDNIQLVRILHGIALKIGFCFFFENFSLEKI